jgi:hypothetical protein
LIFRVTAFDVQGWLRHVGFQWREEPPLARVDLEAEPVLAVIIAQIDVAPGIVRDLDRGQDWFVGDVLEAFKAEVHLDLAASRRGDKQKCGQQSPERHRREE